MSDKPTITDAMFTAYRGALKAHIDALPAEERKPGRRGLILSERLKAALRWQAMFRASAYYPTADDEEPQP
jgi:hypothetical protein